MRAANAIAYFAQLRGVPGAEAHKRAKALLDEFGLGEFARTKCEALSKGMAQKVQLLATIAHEPELLVLDEPFSGLDPINQETLENLIRRQADAGRTILFSTHVMQHAERLCDRFLILAHGQKRFEGTLDEARAAFSNRLYVRTNASIEQLQSLGGIATIEREGAAGETGEASYVIELGDGVDMQTFLERMVGGRLSRVAI